MFASRIARSISRDGNPLRRASDRFEARVTVLLIVVLLVVGPWAAWWAARASYREVLRAQEWDRQHRFRVQAVLVGEPSRRDTAVEEVPPPEEWTAPAEWTAPDGSPRTGALEAGVRNRIGDRFTIWIDDRGAVVGSPLRRTPWTEAGMSAAGAVFGLAGGLAGLRLLTRQMLDRWRMRSWQTQWIDVEPRWTGRG